MLEVSAINLSNRWDEDMGKCLLYLIDLNFVNFEATPDCWLYIFVF
jgi:hypothetical protein